ncbi:predicted protein [Histoplasma capsulatum var. duboisii H88]|uniref:Predicted protein n=2 Tax=Ajellomyces capsulatus TaxID=5037 RepID=F0U6Q4_AJEC8|nr:predicted protein [Histoplasma capsulatum H143]EGC40693.1 predicted protein [Histoplasma capsulatum var. duboisii H88]
MAVLTGRITGFVNDDLQNPQPIHYFDLVPSLPMLHDAPLNGTGLGLPSPGEQKIRQLRSQLMQALAYPPKQGFDIAGGHSNPCRIRTGPLKLREIEISLTVYITQLHKCMIIFQNKETSVVRD